MVYSAGILVFEAVEKIDFRGLFGGN